MRLAASLPFVAAILSLSSFCTAGLPSTPVATLTVAGAPPLELRQDGGTTNTTPSPTQDPSSSTTSSITPSSKEDERKSTRTTSAAASTRSVPSAGGDVTRPTQSSKPVKKEDRLPLQPTLTPAVGVAGAILIITGALYTLIGIKSEWLYISFSTMYLISLSILVLIVYVMNPPVSNAVQGAYFVACFIPGVVFGGISIIFKEVTDKLACLLGGFCLSMWFLTLKEGGLIASSMGKIIFIVVMCVGGACLAFSRHTKAHGFIVSISLSGATSTVLGIDCFSRAGLKEFWIYIWNLNDEEFPIGTTTYPITRGIRVELAATIIITLLGLVSQYKIWKIVQKRRERKSEAQREADDNLSQMEAAVGRRVQSHNERDLVRWQATFEGKRTSTAALTSDSMTEIAPKITSSEQTSSRTASESIEMDDIESAREKRRSRSRPATGSKRRSTRAVQVSVVDEDSGSKDQVPDNWDPARKDSARRFSLPRSHRNSTDMDQLDVVESGMPSARSSVRVVSVPPPPEVIPPPFAIPAEEDVDDASSNAGSVNSTAALSAQERRASSRFSIRSNMKRLSARASTAQSESREALVIPHEDDKRSSLAATLDERDTDIGSLPALSLPPSPALDTGMFENEGGSPLSVSESALKQLAGDKPSATPDRSSFLDPNVDRRASQTEIAGGSKRNSTSSVRESTTAADDVPVPQTESSNVVRGKSTKSRRTSGESRALSTAELENQLPDRLSKVAMTYRTNEWAKHLEGAELPEVDELQEMSAPGISAVSEEAPAPVQVVIEQPQRPIRQSSQAKNNPYRHSKSGVAEYQSSPQVGLASLSRPSTALRPSTSQRSVAGGLSRPASQHRMSSGGFGMHSSPSLATLQSGMSSEVLAERMVPSPLPAQNTLIGQRNSMLQSRPVSTSFANPISPDDSASVIKENIGVPAAILEDASDDDIPLSQRKAAIQMQQNHQPPATSYGPKPPIPTRKRQSTWSTPYQPRHSGFDSHQPQRESQVDPARRQQMLASWRESVRHDLPSGNNSTSELRYTASLREERYAEMVQGHRQEQARLNQRAAQVSQRDNARDSKMRGRDMLEAHAAAMKKMQANANKV